MTENKQNSDYSRTCLTFHCSDMMKEAVKGADFDYIQLNGGILNAELLRVELLNLCIDYGNYNLGLFAQGGMPRDRHTIGMILSCQTESRYFKVGTEIGDIIYLPPGCELDVILGNHPQWCTLSFDSDYFEDVLRRIMGEDFEFLSPHAVVIANNSATVKLLQTVRTVLFSQEHLLIGEKSQKANQAMSDDLLELCIRTVFEAPHRPKENTDRRSKLVLHAEDFLNDYGIDPIKVKDLARDLNVSLRSLEYAFKDIYGIPPKRYLLVRKLNIVRQEIFNNPKKTISDHAINQGFWHMSQFAWDYKLLFGELPSETKEKALSQIQN